MSIPNYNANTQFGLTKEMELVFWERKICHVDIFILVLLWRGQFIYDFKSLSKQSLASSASLSFPFLIATSFLILICNGLMLPLIR